VQANFDFSDRAEAAKDPPTAMGVTSIVNVRLLRGVAAQLDGKPNWVQEPGARRSGWKTDGDRCGLLPFVFQADFRFPRLRGGALDVPMFFLS